MKEVFKPKLPLAACRLPLAACRLPLAACRLPLAAVLMIAIMSVVEAQQAPPYDPCLAPFASPCPVADGFTLCEEYGSQPTDEGYFIGEDENSVTYDLGIPLFGGTVADKTIEVWGTYIITKRAVFRNCIFKMHGGSKIVLQP